MRSGSPWHHEVPLSQGQDICSPSINSQQATTLRTYSSPASSHASRSATFSIQKGHVLFAVTAHSGVKRWRNYLFTCIAADEPRTACTLPFQEFSCRSSEDS
eukprot:757745-Hanusia_phi.AAC.5